MRVAMQDVLILGSGAGGGPLALQLSRAGLSVLVLEKGPRHPREAYLPDEVAVFKERFFLPDLADDPHTVVTRKTTEPTRTHLGWISTCVGGGTVHMGSYLYRFHPDDFRMASRFGSSGGGAQGELELADWPFTYDELEPYYCQSEWEVGVAGRAGANPFEGPRSRPFPLPPLDAHPLSGPFEAVCRARGLHPFPTPRGINSRPYQGRPACSYCDACAGFGCRTGAKGSSQEALLPRAEATGRCEVRPLSMAREITLGKDGRATGAVYLDADGREHHARARVVCVCCSAVESARLLLLSTSSRFPHGLANGSGRVGRHLQFHAVSMGQARLPRALFPDGLLDDPHPFLGRSLMDHYFLPEGVSDLAKGGLLRFEMMPLLPLLTAEHIAFGGGRVLWGEELLERLRGELRDFRGVEFEVFHDFLPNRGTWMELDPDVKDRWGLPVARIHLDLPPHHRRVGAWCLERAGEILSDLGAEEIRTTDVGGTSAYLVHGTCRAGTDPATSVVDAHLRAHEVPNLFVVDGSFMPTSGGAAPTLTILAASFRTAAHIVAELRGRGQG